MFTETIPSCSLSGCHRTHAPDPETISKAKPATLVSTADGQRILKEFSLQYVGMAYGIAKVELETSEGAQHIVAFVNDWNGVVNIPTNYQGLSVSFTQFVPPGAIFGL